MYNRGSSSLRSSSVRCSREHLIFSNALKAHGQRALFAYHRTALQVINSFFDWSKMQPAHAEKSGNVYLCCCIPRGRVTVVADFDKGAYAAGETAQIRAVINNESKRSVV